MKNALFWDMTPFTDIPLSSNLGPSAVQTLPAGTVPLGSVILPAENKPFSLNTFPFETERERRKF